MGEPNHDDASLAFSLIRGDPLFRLQQAVGLIGHDGGLRVVRRAVLIAGISWLPLVVWAIATGRALGHTVAEPLFEHFGVHVRSLVAIPLLVIADATTQTMLNRVIPYFVTSGLLDESAGARYAAVLRDVARLREHWVPWLIILALVIVTTLSRPMITDVHELRWATDEGLPGHAITGLGGWWLMYVTTPVFLGLLLAWIWRLILLWVLLWRLAHIGLSIVPTHPDRRGGLGFVDLIPSAFAPVVLAVSAVASSRWAHDLVYHDVSLKELRVPAASLIVVIALFVLGPFFAFSGPLRNAKRRGLLEYGALVARHGRRVRQRWILREPVEDDAVLSAAELGPVADVNTMYSAVAEMLTIPIGARGVVAVVLPAALPMLITAAIRIPFKDLLLSLFKALI